MLAPIAGIAFIGARRAGGGGGGGAQMPASGPQSTPTRENREAVRCAALRPGHGNLLETPERGRNSLRHERSGLAG